MPATRRPSIGRSTCESCASGEKSSRIPPAPRSSAPCAAEGTCSPQPAKHLRWTEAKLPHRTTHFRVFHYLCFVVNSATKQFSCRRNHFSPLTKNRSNSLFLATVVKGY